MVIGKEMMRTMILKSERLLLAVVVEGHSGGPPAVARTSS